MRIGNYLVVTSFHFSCKESVQGETAASLQRVPHDAESSAANDTRFRRRRRQRGFNRGKTDGQLVGKFYRENSQNDAVM